MKKIRVLIVDDSHLVCQTLSEILSSDPQIEVMATAADPLIAADRIREKVPDVITLDVEMPRMDGLTFLKMIMALHPIPVVICSSYTEKGSVGAFTALEYGAVEIITKPQVGVRRFLDESRVRICNAVKAAARARLHLDVLPNPARDPQGVPPREPVPEKQVLHVPMHDSEKIVVVGASTGGTEALRVFLSELPADAPGLVIVQHMPENFTKDFAERLDGICRISVKEAENNEIVTRGRALIAPGNHHLMLKRLGEHYHVEIKEGPLVSYNRPSVDVLFRSAARYAGKNAIGVILTGMGSDGAAGMRELKDAGALTIAQDEATCIVFGMPHEAIKLGCIDFVVPLTRISSQVMALSGQRVAG